MGRKKKNFYGRQQFLATHIVDKHIPFQIKSENKKSRHSFLKTPESNGKNSLSTDYYPNVDFDGCASSQQIENETIFNSNSENKIYNVTGEYNTVRNTIAQNVIKQTKIKPTKVHTRKHLHEKPFKCPDCDFWCSILSTFVNHKRKHASTKPLQCKQCSFKTAQQSSLTRHIATLHQRRLDLSCKQCTFKCSTQKKLNNHMVVHSGKSYFECTYCEYKHCLQAAVNRHMITHTDNTKLKCRFCSYRAVQPEYVQRHMSKHHSECASEVLEEPNKNSHEEISSKTKYPTLENKNVVVQLSRCDDTNTTETSSNILSNLNELLEKSLLEQFKEFSCKLVHQEQSGGEGNSVVSDLDMVSSISQEGNFGDEVMSAVTHKSITTQGNHKIVSSVMCVDKETSILSNKDPCTRTRKSNNKVELKKYDALLAQPKSDTVSINEIVFKKCNQNLKEKEVNKCSDCSYSSTSISKFKNHLKTHSGRELFNCKECGFLCSSQSSLYRHRQLKHSNKKPYECESCDFKSAIRQYLKNHMRTHSTEKPFACNKCDFRGMTAFALKKHKNRHDGIKPFACNLCDYRCDTKSYLKIHSFIHTGETKFICKLCNYKCAKNYTLKRHMEVHKSID